jgi:hypothetical protein
MSLYDMYKKFEEIRAIHPIDRIEWHPNTGIVVVVPDETAEGGERYFWFCLDACQRGFGAATIDDAIARAFTALREE